MTWTLSKLFVFNSLALKDGEVNVKQAEERESLFTLYKHIYLSVLPPKILWLWESDSTLAWLHLPASF